MKSTFIFDGGAHPPRGAGFGALPGSRNTGTSDFHRRQRRKRRFSPARTKIVSLNRNLLRSLRFLLFNLIRLSTINYQLLPSTPVDCFQIADAAVGKNEQVPVAVDVCRLDEPGPAGKFIRT